MGVGLSFFLIWLIAVFFIALDEQKDLFKTDVCQKEQL